MRTTSPAVEPGGVLGDQGEGALHPRGGVEPPPPSSGFPSGSEIKVRVRDQFPKLLAGMLLGGK